MKERVFQSEEQILAAITDSWNELTFEDIQRVFHNWMGRLTWVIANSGEYYQSKWLGLPLTFLDQEIARGAQDFFTPNISLQAACQIPLNISRALDRRFFIPLTLLFVTSLYI
jgi:hypothetical protein